MNTFQRFLSWILSFVKQSKYKEYKTQVERKRPKYKGYCECCNKKESFPNYFYCKYCKQYYCTKHRLPEQHRCTGNPKKPHDLNENITPLGDSYKKK